MRGNVARYFISEDMLSAAIFLLATIVSSVRLNPVIDIVVSQSQADLDSPGRESHKLLVKKTEKAVLGEPFELSCSLETSGELELCTWSRNGGAEMFLLEGKLLDHERREIEGISVESRDTK